MWWCEYIIRVSDIKNIRGEYFMGGGEYVRLHILFPEKSLPKYNLAICTLTNRHK
jgi:hypothetical protein